MSLALALGIACQGYLRGPDPFPDPWVEPGRGKLLWIQSPNCDSRPKNTVVDTIVLHATVTPTLEATTKWFCGTESQVSSHFTIGKDGSVVQHVSIFDRAWHAGQSVDSEGRERVNAFSVGIELVNLNDGEDPFPIAQLSVLRSLIYYLTLAYPIRIITSHEHIARPMGRKSDPKGFPWVQLSDCGLQVIP